MRWGCSAQGSFFGPAGAVPEEHFSPIVLIPERRRGSAPWFPVLALDWVLKLAVSLGEPKEESQHGNQCKPATNQG